MTRRLLCCLPKSELKPHQNSNLIRTQTTPGLKPPQDFKCVSSIFRSAKPLSSQVQRLML
jgi:hypothetical protein